MLALNMSLWVLDKDEIWFPYRNEMDGDIVAVGGDLDWRRVLKGFEKSCFPLFAESEDIKWWSPELRAVFFPHLHPGFEKELNKIKAKGITFQWDADFSNTVRLCSRQGVSTNPWLHDSTISMFNELHVQGFAHSLEVYQDGELIGGLMGVGLGRVFYGLSMFHIKSNGSKWALMYLIEFLKLKKWKLLDAQQMTPFLAKMGAIEIHREKFLDKMLDMYRFGTPRGDWSKQDSWITKDAFPKYLEMPESRN
jgi:leucyl/phenylalanyl-tRNA--protein transferase